MLASTSASHTCGSTPFKRAVWINVYMIAARSPPRSEPANSHDLRPSAMPRSSRSAALLVKQIRPSSRKHVKAAQRLREFWARAPADALGVKQEFEKALARDGRQNNRPRERHGDNNDRNSAARDA